MNQLPFKGNWYRPPVRLTRGDQIEEEAAAYLRDNPDFWQEFCRRSFQLIDAGRAHYAVAGIVEVIRWHSNLGRGEPYRINNNHRAVFARIFEATYPEHTGFFRTRERVSQQRGARL